jgi:TPR repeat protein
MSATQPVALLALAVSGLSGVLLCAQPAGADAGAVRPPAVMHWCAQHCATWVWMDGRYVGEGTQHPERTPRCGVTVERFTRESVIMHRTDCAPYPGTAVLTGQLSADGNSIVNGIIRWTWHPCCGLSSGPFQAAWGSAIGTVPPNDQERAAIARRQAPAQTPAPNTGTPVPVPPSSEQVGICTSPGIRVAMQAVEDRAIHDPNGAILQLLGAMFTGINASSGRPTVIDSKIGADGGRYTSKDPGSFVCRGLFLRRQVKIEELPDADAAADVTAGIVEKLTKMYPWFIEWFKVKQLENDRYLLTLLPSSLQLSREYFTEFTISGGGDNLPMAMGCPDGNGASTSQLESQFGAAAQGQSGAATLQASRLLEAGNYAEALRLYRLEADAGDPVAMRRTGAFFDLGRGVAQDYHEAMRWYRRADASGDSTAAVNIGRLYDRGRGVAQSYAEAVNWYRKAAAAGQPVGMLNLGLMYSDGDGVPQDYNEAYRWFQKAAAAGDFKAMNNIGAYYEKGIVVRQDFAEAMKWYRKAADGDVPLAMTGIGYLYEGGRGVPKSAAQAVCWYRKAIANGDSLAMTYLGVMYLDGRGVPQVPEEALKLFQRAAQLGQPLAMNNMGAVYENGTGVRRNRDEAVRWYRQAAALGEETAKANLARLGETVPR